MGPLSRTAAAINSHKQNSGRSLSTAAAFLVVLEMLAQPVFAQSPALVLPDGTNFTVESTNHGIVAKPAAGSTQLGGIKASKADTNLRAAALGASQTFVLGTRAFDKEGHRYLVLAVSKPSVKKQGAGFCGAGSEDHLLLVEWKPGSQELALRDDMLVQSCLKSMALQSDQGSDLSVVTQGISQPEPLRLSWLTHPEFEGQAKTFVVVNGKWVAQ